MLVQIPVEVLLAVVNTIQFLEIRETPLYQAVYLIPLRALPQLLVVAAITLHQVKAL